MTDTAFEDRGSKIEDRGSTSVALDPRSSIHHPPHPAHLAHHFEDVEQQRESSTLGMWVFLATEVLFLGALFAAYLVYRSSYAAAFAAASHHLNVPLASINTGVLLCSSFTMALAVHAAQTGKRRQLIVFLLLTMLLGAVFLGIKFTEYYVDYQEHLVPLTGFDFAFEGPDAQKARLFFDFYFALTGLHALHMILGIGLMAVITFLAWRNRFSPEYYTPVELSGLYWHFVDIVWVFLFPMLYLLHQH
jgi:cytochrome c oxidase subunit 3